MYFDLRLFCLTLFNTAYVGPRTLKEDVVFDYFLITWVHLLRSFKKLFAVFCCIGIPCCIVQEIIHQSIHDMRSEKIWWVLTQQSETSKQCFTHILNVLWTKSGKKKKIDALITDLSARIVVQCICNSFEINVKGMSQKNQQLHLIGP